MDLDSTSRNSTIIKYNIAGVIINFSLSLAKIAAGLAVHSHAVVLDAINGIVDTVSSALAIVSAAFGNKDPNKEHPMGYGRVEYLFAIFITLIIMAIGVYAIVEAVKGIIHPHDAPKYDTITVVIMIASFFLKASYGIMMRRKGREIQSDAMIMTGTDSLGDSMTSLGILAAIVICRTTSVNIEHFVCIVISVMILYTGNEMLKDSFSKVLGTRADKEFLSKIRKLLIMEDEVLNINNLVVHSYGEGRYYGSVDIEVDEDMKASDITRISRRLIRHAAAEGLVLTSVGVSGTNVSDPEASEIWDNIVDIATKHDNILRVHSFTVDFDEKVISFYVIQDYSLKNRKDLMEVFRNEIEKLYPDIKIEIFEGIDI